MKKPLLVILIIGLIPVFFLLIGLIFLKDPPKDLPPNQNNDYVYPYSDNVLLFENESRILIHNFFDMRSKGEDPISLFKDKTLDQLIYANIYNSQLDQLLKHIELANLIDISPFEVNSWTSIDHIYLVSYEMKITDGTISPFGSDGINNKLFLLSNMENRWYITDVTEAP